MSPDLIGFSKFTKAGSWNVDDVLMPIYGEAAEVLGRKFNYPDPTKKD